jgi:ribosomal protein S18 acetylase RimI-like enzyme
MSFKIRNARVDDYDSIIKLWQCAGLPYEPEGRDSREAVARQIKRSRRLIFVAEAEEGALIGIVLGSHDGRRGFINRLAVDPAYRRHRIAQRLVRAAEEALKAEGIRVLGAMIEDRNAPSMALFKRLGYVARRDIIYFRKVL